MNRIPALFAVILLLAAVPLPAQALDLGGLFKPKPPLTEDERRETLERIREVQDKLKLLQDKLRVLEKRKAAEAAAKSGDTAAPQAVAGEENWQAVDQLHVNPGEFGVYTYLLFAGDETDSTALGSLEDLILTIETLPANPEPAAIGNRFLLPVEVQQSTVVLARRPYDFKLSRSYLERLGLSGLPNGPVLVSLATPLDPFALEMAPPFLAVVLNRQEPQRNQALARIWHGYEKPAVAMPGHPMADLFWQLIDGTGPTRVTRTGGKLLIDLSPTIAVPHGSDDR